MLKFTATLKINDEILKDKPLYNFGPVVLIIGKKRYSINFLKYDYEYNKDNTITITGSVENHLYHEYLKPIYGHISEIDSVWGIRIVPDGYYKYIPGSMIDFLIYNDETDESRYLSFNELNEDGITVDHRVFDET